MHCTFCLQRYPAILWIARDSKAYEYHPYAGYTIDPDHNCFSCSPIRGCHKYGITIEGPKFTSTFATPDLGSRSPCLPFIIVALTPDLQTDKKPEVE